MPELTYTPTAADFGGLIEAETYRQLRDIADKLAGTAPMSRDERIDFAREMKKLLGRIVPWSEAENLFRGPSSTHGSGSSGLSASDTEQLVREMRSALADIEQTVNRVQRRWPEYG